MASGRSMSSSVLGSSDVIHDFSCTPCSEEGKNMEAITFCVNCQTYFCESCVRLHNKVLKTHNVLDKSAMKGANADKRIQTKSTSTSVLPADVCVDHPGNVIQMYCGEHDLVCCTVCIAVDHRTCKDVDFIPKVAKGNMKGQERTETKTSLDAVYKDLQQLKAKKCKELSELNTANEHILNEIENFKARILARINEQERKSVTDVHTKYEAIYCQINSEIKSLDECLKMTAEQIETLDEMNEEDEVQLFVGVKLGQKAKTKGEHLFLEMQCVDPRTISFEFDCQFESVVKDIESFGTVSDNIYRSSTTSSFRAYNCKTRANKSDCLIFDSCVLDSGHVLITDYNNQELKRLDSTYKMKDSCSIHRPYGVCQTGPNEVAVSSWDGGNVHFVTIGNTMTVNGSFSLGEECRGIVHHNGELFIACGSQNGGNNSVKVYDMSGRYLRTLQCMFSFIMHISMTYDGSHIFVADTQKGLVKLNSRGLRISKYSDHRLQYISGVCDSGCGILFICCKDSNNVVQFDKDENLIKEILTATDGIQSPVSVTFVKAQKRLILTFWPSNTIKVFKLT